MLHFARWKIIAIALVCLGAVIATLPNFFERETMKSWPSWVPQSQLQLGLDLRGGVHLLMALDEAELRTDWLGSIRQDARKQLRDAKIGFTNLGLNSDEVRITLAKPTDTDTALTELRKIAQSIGNPILGQTGNDIEVSRESDGVVAVRPTDQGMLQRLTSAVETSIEIIRSRIDKLGTTEPTIARQGRARILVQVPGFDNASEVIDLIGKTAKLSFHEVHPTISAEEARATRLPIGYKIYPSDDGVDTVVREIPVVRGDRLVDAQPGFDQRTNEPIISFRFDQSGARQFGNFTRNHVGDPFAIVLDNGKREDGSRDITILSAPVIREPILGGSGQISGSFTVDSANQLAIQVRSGALPATLTPIEQRTVGPSLGADSIQAGEIAGLVGGLCVAAFILFAYGFFGVFALAAVLVNLILIVGIMSLLGSTLTLPGIAGLVLTVGMAVDANVLIYERIREELRNGKQPISAIDSGFSRALSTIIDSNLTTLIAGIVMFWLGSGPVRGFAVTLSLGIFATVFTAFTVTRLLVALWVARQKSRKIPAPI